MTEKFKVADGFVVPNDDPNTELQIEAETAKDSKKDKSHSKTTVTSKKDTSSP